MALRSPRRLPKQFRRPVSASTRKVARHYYATNERRLRKRKERIVRLVRRLSQLGRVIASEFRLWLFISTVVVAVAVGLVLLFAPLFDVRQIQVRRQDSRIDPEDVQNILSPIFRRRMVLVTRGEIRSLLQQRYPDIVNVEIEKDYPSTLKVTVSLEPVVAAIAIESHENELGTESGSVKTQSGSQKYTYITEKGYLVSSPIQLTKEPLETLTMTDWNIRPQERTVLLDPKQMKTIFLARDTLRRDFGLSAKKIIVYLQAQEFHIKTPKVTLWFDLRGDLPLQFERFRVFLKTLSLDVAKEYIDLRIMEKVIYK